MLPAPPPRLRLAALALLVWCSAAAEALTQLKRCEPAPPVPHFVDETKTQKEGQGRRVCFSKNKLLTKMKTAVSPPPTSPLGALNPEP